MALVVEDGTGKADAESYISVAGADAYHAARGHTGWTGDDSAKEAALRIATEYIDGRYRGRWRGKRNDADQALAWPRKYALDEDGYAIDDDIVPVPLQQAAAEAALLSLSGTDLTPSLARGGAVESESVKVGPIEESTTFRASAPARTTFTKIDDLLSGLIQSRGASGFLERA